MHFPQISYASFWILSKLLRRSSSVIFQIKYVHSFWCEESAPTSLIRNILYFEILRESSRKWEIFRKFDNKVKMKFSLRFSCANSKFFSKLLNPHWLVILPNAQSFAASFLTFCSFIRDFQQSRNCILIPI